METTNPTVHILLPTYNGALYLRQQLDSLIAQDYQNIVIHIRDDGSTDATPEILNEYARTTSSIDINLGKNIGLFRNLNLLLDRTADSNDLFALCDQDDVWNHDKISAAVITLMQQQNPESSLYVSRLQFVDEQLNHLVLPKPKRHFGFSNAVVESAFSGCSMVFGNNIRKLILRSQPSDWIMHDWWIYLVSSSLGSIVYDPQPHMLYRRHTTNTSGWQPSLLERIKDRVSEFTQRHRNGTVGFASLRQAERFLNTYRDLISEDQRRLITDLVDMRNKGTTLRRLRYTLSPRVIRESWIDDMAMRLMIFMKQH